MRNLCPNPALAIDLTGWDEAFGATLTRVSVTGFARPNAAQMVGTGGARYVRSAPFAAAPGVDYTWVGSLRRDTATNVDFGVEWFDSGSGSIGTSEIGNDTYTSGVKTLAFAGTAPANAATGRVFLGFLNTVAGEILQASCVRVDLGTASVPYRDGDSPGWSWDGTPGGSTSGEATTEVRSFTATVGVSTAASAIQSKVAGLAASTSVAVTSDAPLAKVADLPASLATGVGVGAQMAKTMAMPAAMPLHTGLEAGLSKRVPLTTTSAIVVTASAIEGLPSDVPPTPERTVHIATESRTYRSAAEARTLNIRR